MIEITFQSPYNSTTMIIDKIKVTVKNSQSVIAFVEEGGFDRYLTIGDQKAFHMGNTCGSCNFVFRRLGAARVVENYWWCNKTSSDGISNVTEEMISKLNSGLNTLDPKFVGELKLIMPKGNYEVILTQATPKLVSPNQPGDYFAEEQAELIGLDRWDELPYYPETKYYRLHKAPMPPYSRFFEFLIPIFCFGFLDKERIAFYENMLENGNMPTAVALSVIDSYAPADRRTETTIYKDVCLAHYLIDGHHKVYAAARLGKPLTILSFIAINHGKSTQSEVKECLQLLLNL